MDSPSLVRRRTPGAPVAPFPVKSVVRDDGSRQNKKGSRQERDARRDGERRFQGGRGHALRWHRGRPLPDPGAGRVAGERASRRGRAKPRGLRPVRRKARRSAEETGLGSRLGGPGPSGNRSEVTPPPGAGQTFRQGVWGGAILIHPVAWRAYWEPSRPG